MFARALTASLLLSLLVAVPAAADDTPTPTPTTPTPTPTTPTPTTPTPTTPTPTASPSPAPAQIRVVTRPKVIGVVRYGKTLRRTLGRYSVGHNTYATRWLRDGKPIPGATKARYRIRPADVGHRLRVRVTVRHPGRATLRVHSPVRRVKHLRDVRHTVKYRIATTGSITTSVATFRRQVAQTLNDPRGWRAAGIRFVEVRSGGSMTVVLAQASRVPWYSSGCSATWSCRVGQYVIINQDRWKHASPAWNAAKGTTRRGYRHMVVNHEVGHWLGWYHKSCGGKGRTAPVMMPQSKGRGGCTFNAWPKPSERNVPRFR